MGRTKSMAIVEQQFVMERPAWNRDQALEDAAATEDVDAKQAPPLLDVGELRAILAAPHECRLAPPNVLVTKVGQLLRRQRLRVRIVDRSEHVDDVQGMPAVAVLEVDRP